MAKVSLTIDGVRVRTKAGSTVLEAAREAGIYIPTLCSRPDLPRPLGDCRVCVVEIEEAEPHFPSSCITPVAQGMVVRTNTSQVQGMRRHFLKALLSPLPSPRLKRPELKRLADYIGVREEDLPPYVSRNLPIDREQPLFELDHNRCILCGLCVRICKEVRGVGAAGFVFRDDRWMIGSTPPAPSLEENGCRFCCACVEVCPTGALADKDGELPGRETRVAPCAYTCPAGIDIPRYIYLISQRRFAEAAAVIREKVPFPGVLGRVCFHPCEEKCRRSQLNEPISISALKRFAAEQDTGMWCAKSKIADLTGKQVAIIGSGPAGLTAGYYLAKLGHSVTVFEALPEAGGMMRVGIPEYRLPREALNSEIEEIKKVGVEIKTGSPVKDLKEVFGQGYEAIFLATGAWVSQKVGIPNEDAKGVLHAIDFLNKVNSGNKVELGKRVAVIGGGNAAIDAARVAKRLGVEDITIVYRRSRTEMPANADEVDEAEREGIKLRIQEAPVKVLTKNDKVTGIQCIRMEMGEPDASGRRRPVPIEGSEFEMEVDNVIMAVGQVVDKEALPKELEYTSRGTLDVDSVTLQTNIKGVFAGGDAVTGPASVIEAIAAGRKAAIAIDKYLGGSGDISETLVKTEEPSPCIGAWYGFADLHRAQMPCLPLKLRMTPAEAGRFTGVEMGFDEETAIEEAKRCLQCQLRYQIQPVEPPPDKRSYSGDDNDGNR